MAMLHLIFVIAGHRQKKYIFNDENFLIYDIHPCVCVCVCVCVQALQVGWGTSDSTKHVTHFLLDVTSSSAAVTLGLARDNPSVCNARYVIEGEENSDSLHHLLAGVYVPW